jgi:hypothetical protein
MIENLSRGRKYYAVFDDWETFGVVEAMALVIRGKEVLVEWSGYKDVAFRFVERERLFDDYQTAFVECIRLQEEADRVCDGYTRSTPSIKDELPF